MKFACRGVVSSELRYRHLLFMCPGCKTLHALNLPAEDGTRPEVCWDWDENEATPTVTPSLLINRHDPETRCHLFVRAGRIEFLSDCYHDQAGTTVEPDDLPDWVLDDL